MRDNHESCLKRPSYPQNGSKASACCCHQMAWQVGDTLAWTCNYCLLKRVVTHSRMCSPEFPVAGVVACKDMKAQALCSVYLNKNKSVSVCDAWTAPIYSAVNSRSVGSVLPWEQRSCGQSCSHLKSFVRLEISWISHNVCSWCEPSTTCECIVSTSSPVMPRDGEKRAVP